MNNNLTEKELMDFRRLAIAVKGAIEVSDKYPGMPVAQEVKEICKKMQYELSKVL